MPRIPSWEKNIIDYMDYRLSVDITVWKADKSRHTDKIFKLYKQVYFQVQEYFEQKNIDYSPEENKQFVNDVFDVLNLYKSGSKPEFEGLLKRFKTSYPKQEYQGLFQNIFNEFKCKVEQIPLLDATWSSLLKFGTNYPFESLDFYLDYLCKRCITDHRFDIKRSVNAQVQSQWNMNPTYLTEFIQPDDAKQKHELWNKLTEQNAGISAFLEGIYYDTDKIYSQIGTEIKSNGHLIFIPKAQDEKQFDEMLGFIKSRIFNKAAPITTQKDLLSHYLPTNLASESYHRIVIKNKKMIIGLLAALFCDRLYVTKDAIWSEKSNEIIVKNLNEAAEEIAKLFSSLGFLLTKSSVITARKKLLKMMNNPK